MWKRTKEKWRKKKRTFFFFNRKIETFSDHLFAILTFESIDDVNRCMEQCEEIRLEHHLIIKRNLKDRPKEQRALTEHVYISLKQFGSSRFFSFSFITRHIKLKFSPVFSLFTSIHKKKVNWAKLQSSSICRHIFFLFRFIFHGRKCFELFSSIRQTSSNRVVWWSKKISFNFRTLRSHRSNSSRSTAYTSWSTFNHWKMLQTTTTTNNSSTSFATRW